mmetsp:Transcript_4080/g.5363  ORF Transcript_4080/g.5363 Transcript_4080/m.5363 type:complete len:333 (-) Transcript_4080:117-1115(-)|eukprot:CAMPEP_0198142058 /NCGR_PEP_ID=MMETSP1443-20131203/4961_1 /TAXON_ID=186043 /ORGANISM="Entomoneis sp., Strain CCMP2396" /LENGTH=332 /DNA_ID=CAMNT_0043804997 /DNA_START=123 /DNA_END=1121 /DNA_ORIENTATION=+
MQDTILSVLEGALRDKGDDDDKTIKLKSLRKLVFMSLQKDEDEKAAKKEYKKAIQALETEEKLVLDADGRISLAGKSGSKKKAQKRKRKELDGDSKPAKKQQNGSGEAEDEENVDTNDQDADDGENEKADDSESKKPCKGNPQGVTRLFLGNLPFAVDETSLKAFIPGVTHIKWITDKETGKFYGSAFVEMDSSANAADAVAKAGKHLMARPAKINFAEARPGDIWPPKAFTGEGGGQAGGSGVKAMSAKPDDCKKLFIGNLSYDIDDDGITKFFSSVDAEIKAVRWLHHKDSGDFKGCGYVEFWKPEDCAKGAALNGKNLLGRPIRIDWSD